MFVISLDSDDHMKILKYLIFVIGFELVTYNSLSFNSN